MEQLLNYWFIIGGAVLFSVYLITKDEDTFKIFLLFMALVLIYYLSGCHLLCEPGQCKTLYKGF